MQKKILIVGAGWLGLRLIKYLKPNYYEILATTANVERRKEIESLECKVIPFETLISTVSLTNFDCLIICIAVKGDEKKYIKSITEISDKIENEKFTGNVMLCSTTGIYELANECNENSSVKENIYHQAEEIISKHTNHYILRIAGLIGDDRNPANFFKNKILDQYNQSINLVHYKDVCRAIALLLHSNNHFGTYNICFPYHSSKLEFYNEQRAKTELDLLEKGIKSAYTRTVNSDKFSKVFEFEYLWDIRN